RGFPLQAGWSLLPPGHLREFPTAFRAWFEPPLKWVSTRDHLALEVRMLVRSHILKIAAAGVIVAGGYAALRPGAVPEVERMDFGAGRRPTTRAYVAVVKPASDAPIKEFRIPITHERIEIAPGVTYEGWSFGGTVPGPVMRVRQGDLVRITLV